MSSSFCDDSGDGCVTGIDGGEKNGDWEASSAVSTPPIKDGSNTNDLCALSGLTTYAENINILASIKYAAGRNYEKRTFVNSGG